MASLGRSSVPAAAAAAAPRKDLNKLTKRKRSAVPKPPPPPQPDPVPLDIDMLLATLAAEDANYPLDVNYYTTTTEQQPPPPPTKCYTTTSGSTRVNYYTCSGGGEDRSKSLLEPRLLLRQAYKIATEAFAVVGLESKGDYDPSIYFVNEISNVKITFEDFVSLNSCSVTSAVDKLFKDSVAFQPFYLDKIALEVSATGGLYFFNYDVYSYKQFKLGGDDAAEIPRSPNGLHLQKAGWIALTKLFDCIESYYKVCAEVSMLVPHLVDRYSRYFTRRYKPQALLLTTNTSSMYPVPALSPDIKQFVTAELPSDMKALSEHRLPVELQSHWYQTSPLREALTPWIDSEVRRYCVPNIVESVLDSLKHAARWF